MKCDICGKELKNLLGVKSHKGLVHQKLMYPRSDFDIARQHESNISEKMHGVRLPSDAHGHQSKHSSSQGKGGGLAGGGMHIEAHPTKTSLGFAVGAAIAERAIKRMQIKNWRSTSQGQKVVENGIKWKQQFDICCLCQRPALYWTPKGKFCGVHKEAAYDAMKKAKAERYNTK